MKELSSDLLAAALVTGLVVSACAAHPPPARLHEPGPEGALRRTIESNRHYSVHCLCRAFTAETIAALKKEVDGDPRLLRALVGLLSDDELTLGIEDTLLSIGEPAARALEEERETSDSKLSGRIRGLLRRWRYASLAAPAPPR